MCKLLKLRFLLLVFIFILYSLLTTFYLYAQETSKEVEALFVAKKAFDDGFYDVSLQLLERFAKSYPDSSRLQEAELLMGECFFYQNKFLEALAKFEQLLKGPQVKDIKDAVFYWIAEVHFRGNDFDKATGYYKKIIQDYPNSDYLHLAYYSLGWCSFQKQDFVDALKFFMVVREKYPKEPQASDASFKIIECLFNLKDYPGLKEKVNLFIKEYLNDDYHLGYLYFYLAEADYYLNNFPEAVQEYTKVIEKIKDEKIQALSRLGISWSFLKLKKYKEAEESFNNIKREVLNGQALDVFLLGQAILMMETNRVSEAEKIYDELLNSTLEPMVLIQAYLGKADALYNLMEYAQAIEVYKGALEEISLKSIPQEIIDKLHHNLAWAYLKQGEFKQAISEFQDIAQKSEDKIVKVSALCQIGDAYQESGDYAKALLAYDKILKDYPDSFYSDYVQYQLGLTFLKDTNYDGAILSFLAVKKNFPQSKLLDDASYALGLTYFQRQDYKLSKEIFEHFEDDFKDSNLKPEALYLLGTSLYNLAKYDQAVEVFKNIIRIYSQHEELVQKAEYEIADCYYQMGDEKEAMARFNSLRSKYPDSSLSDEIMWWLGEYYYRHNDLVSARRYFSTLIKDFPKSDLVSDAYYILGSSFSEESKYLEAIKNFKKVIEIDKSDLAGQAAIAIVDIYLKQKNFDLALREYEQVLKIYPNLSNLIYPKIADLLFKNDRLDEAIGYYRKSLDVVPVREMPEIQLKIAEVLETQKSYDQAIEEYLKVTYLYAENEATAVKALLRVAGIYEFKDNYKQAINIYKRIISMDAEESKYALERIDLLEGRKGWTYTR